MAKAAAMAASTALPPASSTVIPAATASGWAAATPSWFSTEAASGEAVVGVFVGLGASVPDAVGCVVSEGLGSGSVGAQAVATRARPASVSQAGPVRAAKLIGQDPSAFADRLGTR